MKKLLSCGLLSLAWALNAEATSKIEYILDVSGSMHAMAGGESRMAAAKKSLTSMVQLIPDGTVIALRLYGHRTPPTDKAGSCQDSEVVIPFGPLNKEQFLSTVKRATPLGQTPIAYSLEQAAHDFALGADEAQTIILVSDGEESCGGDPVATAKALIAKGFKLKINVIGLDVDATAKNQLADIATATGGQYFDARDAASLTSSLQKLTQESLVISKAGSSVYGEETRGGDNYETAVALSPNKLFRLNHHQRKNQYDYFFVDAKPGQKLTVSLETGEKGVEIKPDNTHQENLNPYAGISLQSPGKNQITSEEIIGGKNTAKQIVYPIPVGGAGPYYILLGSAYDSQHKDHRFKVEITEQFDAGSQQDAGDTRDTALAIPPGIIKGYIHPNDGTDTYKVQLPAGALALRARPTSEKVGLTLELFDSEGVKVANGASPNYGAVAKLENVLLLKSGEYIVKLWGGYSPAETDYTLEILPGGGAPATDPDAGGTSSTAAAPLPPRTALEPTPLAVSIDQPISKPAPLPPAPLSLGAASSKAGICQLYKQLSWMEKLKLGALVSGIPLLSGWLLGMIWGYFKGRRSGKRWAARQALKQNSKPAPN